MRGARTPAVRICAAPNANVGGFFGTQPLAAQLPPVSLSPDGRHDIAPCPRCWPENPRKTYPRCRGILSPLTLFLIVSQTSTSPRSVDKAELFALLLDRQRRGVVAGPSEFRDQDPTVERVVDGDFGALDDDRRAVKWDHRPVCLEHSGAERMRADVDGVTTAS